MATDADSIRILVATDNHVGYNERDATRGDDSWKTFHEIMCLASSRDVDMVLLAGDLFHDNKPSRKALYQVMRSLRMNCLGGKPCSLEMLSDASDNFSGAFDHVNYEDADINVAIPVFSIHGNHDDPTGEANLAALDLLQMCGLVNYYGRTPEADNISVKPVLLQKGGTKLALYGMSNVRDERLFRTFRDRRVRFYEPSVAKDEWFNILSVHQNHVAHTDTGYLPETFIPSSMDLVIWGHEHECLIDPRYNPEQGFHVMQPGSSVATSLMPGEAVTKHVAIVTVTGKEFTSEAIRLRTVRPFLMREVVLADERAMKGVAKRPNNRGPVTRHLEEIVKAMISEANAEWRVANPPGPDDDGVERVPPKPLIRLKVEYSPPEDGGRFDCENPQRFSQTFADRVANASDVVSFYRKKKAVGRAKAKGQVEMPDESVMAQLDADSVKVEKLIREFLAAQSLTILPSNQFGDAIGQFVDKDDKYAIDTFVKYQMEKQHEYIKGQADIEDSEAGVRENMAVFRERAEALFRAGRAAAAGKKKKKLKAKPDGWDSDIEGEWAEQPAALVRDDEGNVVEEEEEDVGLGSVPTRTTATAAGARRKAPAKAASGARGLGAKKSAVVEEDDEEEEEEDDDVVMIDDDEDEEEEEEEDEEDEEDEDLFVRQKPAKARAAPKKTTARAAPARRAASPAKKKAPPAKKAPVKGRQSKLDFSQPRQVVGKKQAVVGGTRAMEPSEDEIDDDDDAFEPVARPALGARGGGRR